MIWELFTLKKYLFELKLENKWLHGNFDLHIRISHIGTYIGKIFRIQPMFTLVNVNMGSIVAKPISI
jgi:hypothetical protein